MIPVLPFDELPDGTARCVDIAGRQVALVRIGTTVHAVDDQCSHAKVSLSDGDVWPEACTIECPRHGSAFSLTDGAPDSLPATRSIAVHRVDVIDGMINVEVAE